MHRRELRATWMGIALTMLCAGAAGAAKGVVKDVHRGT
jgi:hypothetical protein